MSPNLTQPEEIELVIRETPELGHMQGDRSFAGRAQESAMTQTVQHGKVSIPAQASTKLHTGSPRNAG
ncbi:MAG: hypothetical protein HY016_11600 [Nitrosomonadales bacterium]|nr:hypothetical protein [Nitrosomonadales bacterium]